MYQIIKKLKQILRLSIAKRNMSGCFFGAVSINISLPSFFFLLQRYFHEGVDRGIKNKLKQACRRQGSRGAWHGFIWGILNYTACKST
jgi:hypothetical protein